MDCQEAYKAGRPLFPSILRLHLQDVQYAVDDGLKKTGVLPKKATPLYSA